jgi:hypothetical protein
MMRPVYECDYCGARFTTSISLRATIGVQYQRCALRLAADSEKDACEACAAKHNEKMEAERHAK